MRTAQERFDIKRIVNPATGCWDWIGATLPNGYGLFRLGSKNIYAHRFAYEALVGAIPTGLDIDHKCRNRRCVNPAHLEPVTRRENIRRGVPHRLRDTCGKGHLFTPENTYSVNTPRGMTKRSCRQCAIDREAEKRKRLSALAREFVRASPDIAMKDSLKLVELTS